MKSRARAHPPPRGGRPGLAHAAVRAARAAHRVAPSSASQAVARRAVRLGRSVDAELASGAYIRHAACTVC